MKKGSVNLSIARSAENKIIGDWSSGQKAFLKKNMSSCREKKQFRTPHSELRIEKKIVYLQQSAMWQNLSQVVYCK